MRTVRPQKQAKQNSSRKKKKKQDNIIKWLKKKILKTTRSKKILYILKNKDETDNRFHKGKNNARQKILKQHQRYYKKTSGKYISLTETFFFNLANGIQQYIEHLMYHNQVRFTPEKKD